MGTRQLRRGSPLKSIQNLRLRDDRHSRLKSGHINDVVLFPLTDPLSGPVKRVLPAPNQRTNHELLKTKFLREFSPQPSFDCFTRLQSATGSNPEPLDVCRTPNPEQEDFPLGSKKNSSDCVALDDQDCD